MENQVPTMDEAVETTCTSCQTIPVSSLQLEVDVPLNGWQQLFDQLEIKPVVDPAGRLAIVLPAARRLFATLRRRAELAVEDHDRLFEKVEAKRPAMAGVPWIEGLNAFESMAVANKIVSPADEFGGGRPKPRFLEDEILAGEQEQAEKKREAAARSAERLARQAKDRLGGKR